MAEETELTAEQKITFMGLEIQRLRNESKLLQHILAACVMTKRSKQILLDRLQLATAKGKAIMINGDEKEGWMDIKVVDKPTQPEHVNGAKRT